LSLLGGEIRSPGTRWICLARSLAT
jgi:hypothetical protein